MKRLLLCLSFLLLACAVPGVAQNVTGPLEDVPLNTWPFAAAETLQKADITFSYPDGTYGGRPPQTRRDFAIALARLLFSAGVVRPETPYYNLTDAPVKLKASPLALNALIALVKEFSPELIKLGLDVPKAATLLAAWQGQQQGDVQMQKNLLTTEQSKNPFADVWPATVYQQRDEMIKAGFVFGGLDEITLSNYRMSHMTRLEFAYEFNLTLTGLNKMPSWELRTRLHHAPKAATVLWSLLDNFMPELKLLGQDTNLFQSRLAEWEGMAPHPLVARPFPDVPRTHWAASSVETLHENGIIVGYPQGSFAISQ